MATQGRTTDLPTRQTLQADRLRDNHTQQVKDSPLFTGISIVCTPPDVFTLSGLSWLGIVRPLRPVAVMAASAPPLHRGCEWLVCKAERKPVLREARGEKQKQMLASALLQAGPGLWELTQSTWDHPCQGLIITPLCE